MALSNRDRVGRMFDVLSPALDAFIARIVGPDLGADASWTMLLALKDQKQHKQARRIRAPTRRSSCEC